MSEARDRLRQAILEVDQEANGERPPEQLMTHYVIVYAHAEFGSAGTAAQISHIYPDDGMPNWQALGLIAAADAYLRHREVHGDDGGDS